MKDSSGSFIASRRGLLHVAVLAALAITAVLAAADATYLVVKARLAQTLISNSWDTALTTGTNPRRPWPWADTLPVARLAIDDIALDTWVLQGSSGTSLAFGPGLANGSVNPGDHGVLAIGAHRDTHFRKLGAVAIGNIVRLQDTSGNWYHYRVTHTSVADIRTDSIRNTGNKARLLLITCYPFDAILPGGPLRYVVETQLIATPAVFL